MTPDNSPPEPRWPVSDPVELFRRWYQESAVGRDGGGAACCLSTVGLDGYPNARFVALKEFDEEGFVVTGSTLSRKGRELAREPRAALTFWWPRPGRQVRIQGDAHSIDSRMADRHFRRRSRDAQLLAWASHPGDPLDLDGRLEAKMRRMADLFPSIVPRPKDWGGYRVVPIRIEFLRFRRDRVHERILFSRCGDDWTSATLQP